MKFPTNIVVTISGKDQTRFQHQIKERRKTHEYEEDEGTQEGKGQKEDRYPTTVNYRKPKSYVLS